MDDELEVFQRRINLTEYAAHLGYRIDRRDSSRNSVIMRKDHDKVAVAVGYTGKWIYFSFRDDCDNGTIIDFVQNRNTRFNLGHVRKALRPWTNGQGTRPVVHIQNYVPKLEPLTTDRQKIIESYCRMWTGKANAYLTEKRAIAPRILASQRFEGCILTDPKGNTVFPHKDRTGLCGFELKNTRFTGFSKHGTKGLWFSSTKPDDTRLVIAETAIDALSFHALHPDEQTRYASIAGQMNPQQPDLVRGAIAKMPEGANIITAMDHDDGGRTLADEIEQIFNTVDRNDLTLLHKPPSEPGADWNDMLKNQSSSFSHCPNFSVMDA